LDNQEFTRQAWKFLMLMPTVPSVVNLVQEDFAAQLREANTTMHLRYLLQSGINRGLPGIKEEILGLLLEGRITEFGLYDALRALSSGAQFRSEPGRAATAVGQFLCRPSLGIGPR
jgi:hypothetical protein